MYYLNVKQSDKSTFRTEILFAPLLIIFPIFVGILFIYDWFYRGFLTCSPAFDVELILGIVILLANILFDIPFIESLSRNIKGK